MMPESSSQFSVLSSQETRAKIAADWSRFFERLQIDNRASVAEIAGRRYWVAAERIEWFRAIHRVETGLCPIPAGQSPATRQAGDEASRVSTVKFDDAVLAAAQGWMAHLGPTTASEIGDLLGLPAVEIEKAVLRMEASGAILRGKFRPDHSLGSLATDGRGRPTPHEIEWCERRLLARIHRLTVATLRKQIAPVTASQFMSWLLRWQEFRTLATGG